jgi:hypothetical protein
MFIALLEAQIVYHEKKEKQKNRFSPSVSSAIGGAAVGGGVAGVRAAVKHRVWNKRSTGETLGLPKKAEEGPSFTERIFGRKNKPVEPQKMMGPKKRMAQFPSIKSTIKSYDMGKAASKKLGSSPPSKTEYASRYLKGKAQGFFGGPERAESAIKSMKKGVKMGAGVGLAAGVVRGIARHRRNKELRKKYNE